MKIMHINFPMGAISALSIALVMPLAMSHAVAEEDKRGSMEETAAQQMTGYDPSTSQRFTAAGLTQRSKNVSWADLDLSTPEGLDKLYLRLSRAAAKVCEPRVHFRHAAVNRVRKSCEKETMDVAVTNIGHNALGEMHVSKTGRIVHSGQQIAER